MIARMAFSREIPEPWYSAMLARNFTHQTTGEPAVIHLAEKAGVSPTTVHRLIDGGGRQTVRPETIRKLAEALGVQPSVVGQWIGVAWGENADWSPPPEINLLTRRERQAVEEIIMCLAASKLGRGDMTVPEVPQRKVKGRAPEQPSTLTTPSPRRVARRTTEKKGTKGPK